MTNDRPRSHQVRDILPKALPLWVVAVFGGALAAFGDSRGTPALVIVGGILFVIGAVAFGVAVWRVLVARS